MAKVVLGIVDTPTQAELVAQRLSALGFAPRDVSMLFPDKQGAYDFAFERHTRAPESALAGAALGAVLGAVLGVAAGVGVLALPALASLIAAGPVLAALAGAALVGVVFAIVGAVFGLGAPKIEAKHYAGKIRTGRILIAIHATKRADVRAARDVLRGVAAGDVSVMGEAAIPAAARA
jgi:hypothetical protein